MANERVIKEVVITPRLSVGDRLPGIVIANDQEIFRSSGDASFGIVTDNSSSAIINFNDGTSNTGQIEFEQSTQTFTVSINSNPTITSDASGTTVHGDLTVEGTTTTVDSTVVAIADNIFLLNKDEPGPGVTLGTAGIEIERGPADDNAGWFFNESANWWGPTGPAGSLEPGVGVTQTIGNINTIDTSTADNILLVEATGAIRIAIGNVGQRPGSPDIGYFRFNTDNANGSELEYYDGTGWLKIVAGSGGTDDFVSSSGDTLTGDLIQDNTASGQFLGHNNNTPTVPAFAFNGDDDTGIYRSADGVVSIASNGTEVASFSPSGFSFDSDLNLGGTNKITSIADPTTGADVGDRDYNDGRYLKRDGSNTIQGTILPDFDNTYDFGSSGFKFATIYATTFDGTATMAQYSDLAERYAADATYEPGTVLIFGGEAEVTLSNEFGDIKVAGIVSTSPGFMLNKDAGTDMTHPYIALKGRVPCKVVGQVKKGDLLTTSSIPGCAQSVGGMKADPHAIIGKAINDYKPDRFDDIGVIEVFVI